jgi:CHAT domain-containing protein
VIKTSEARLQIIAQTKADVAGLPVLHNVRAEVVAIQEAALLASVATTSGVDQAYSTSISQALESIPSSNIVHVASHGLQDSLDALNSGFCLRVGRLTVSQLMDLNVNNALLAFLSACETAKADPKDPDQAVHLAAAMLFAGFKGVIATMW